MKVGILSCGPANVGSVVNMVRRIGHDCELISNKNFLSGVDKLIFPGVGSFDNALSELEKAEIVAALEDRVVAHGVPILGICIGMQLFMQSSEEGAKDGFGWIKGRVKRFNNLKIEPNMKVPHIGWNYVIPKEEHWLISPPEARSKFYFLHSYFVECDDKNNEVGITRYGVEFSSLIQKDNIVGAQFHPEKSHRYGLNLMKNFIEKKF